MDENHIPIKRIWSNQLWSNQNSSLLNPPPPPPPYNRAVQTPVILDPAPAVKIPAPAREF